MMIQFILGLVVYSVVPHVDFDRYQGTWHEIARFPNRFQKKCVGDVTATYSLRNDGKLDVLNRCRVGDGSYISARGIARTTGKNQPNSMLKVRFAPGFLSFLPVVWGDYHVLILASDYSYAAVGSPDRRYLWILARNPAMAASTYREIVEEVRAKGFDVEQLSPTAPFVAK
jgi:apolipoprotein D and lipocalin family protein